MRIRKLAENSGRASENEDVLNETKPAGVKSPTEVELSPVWVQNWFPLPVPMPAISWLVRTEKGVPDWYWKMPEISQPPTAYQGSRACS